MCGRFHEVRERSVTITVATLEVGEQVSTREKHVCVTTCLEPWGKWVHAYVRSTYGCSNVLSNYLLDGNANLMVPGQRKEPDPGTLAENLAEVLSDGVGLIAQSWSLPIISGKNVLI